MTKSGVTNCPASKVDLWGYCPAVTEQQGLWENDMEATGPYLNESYLWPDTIMYHRTGIHETLTNQLRSFISVSKNLMCPALSPVTTYL